jgi:hypothetical protein
MSQSPTAPLRISDKNERLRFERDLARLAFMPDYAITYAETAERLLLAAATIVAGEGLNEEAAVAIFRRSVEKARAFDKAIDELGEFAEMVLEGGLGEA